MGRAARRTNCRVSFCSIFAREVTLDDAKAELLRWIDEDREEIVGPLSTSSGPEPEPARGHGTRRGPRTRFLSGTSSRSG